MSGWQPDSGDQCLGNSTQYQYDALGRQTVVINALNQRTSTLFDANGNVTRVTNARGYSTQFQYDALNRQSVVIDALGRRTTTLFDATSNVTGVIDATGVMSAYGYDSLNRRYLVVNQLGYRTTTLFDAAGNATGMLDPLGNSVQSSYDGLNRVSVSIDARGYRTTQVFDSAGNLVSLTDASNNTTTFLYDALNRKTGEIDATGQRSTFLYNALGLQTGSIDRLGRERRFSYDALNRLTTQTWHTSAGTPVETLLYSYDAVGNQLTARDSDGTWTFTYDALNRVASSKDVWGLTLTMTYDAVGNRIRVQDSRNGLQTSLYDAVNNLSQRMQSGSGVTPLRLDFTYTARNQQATIQRYNGSPSLWGGLSFSKTSTTTYTYDAAGQLTNQKTTSIAGNNLGNYTYTYDAAGRPTTEVYNGAVKTYTYDASNQLTGDGVNTITYDGTGNRTNGSNYVGPVNRLITDGTWNYTYDHEGNQTKKVHVSTGETWTYGYDQRNQLTVVEKRATDGGTLQLKADLRYDALGNRIEYKVDTDGNGSTDLTQRYALDGFKRGPQTSFVGLENWDVWAELNASGSLTTRYLRGDLIDQVFASTQGTYPTWLVADRLGSIRDVLTGSGLTGHRDYDGFGNLLSDTTPAPLSPRYAWTGRERDKEIGLQYHRARYYDPATGRWLSPDPMGFSAGDSNLYRYVNNQVTTATDPSGNWLVATNEAAADAWLSELRGFGLSPSKVNLAGDEYYIHIDAHDRREVDRVLQIPDYANGWGKNLRESLFSPVQHIRGSQGLSIAFDSALKKHFSAIAKHQISRLSQILRSTGAYSPEAELRSQVTRNFVNGQGVRVQTSRLDLFITPTKVGGNAAVLLRKGEQEFFGDAIAETLRAQLRGPLSATPTLSLGQVLRQRTTDHGGKLSVNGPYVSKVLGLYPYGTTVPEIAAIEEYKARKTDEEAGVMLRGFIPVVGAIDQLRMGYEADLRGEGAQALMHYLFGTLSLVGEASLVYTALRGEVALAQVEGRLAVIDGRLATIPEGFDLGRISLTSRRPFPGVSSQGSGQLAALRGSPYANYLVVYEGENVYRLYRVEANALHRVETTYESVTAARNAVGTTGTVIEVPRGIAPAGSLNDVIRFERRIGAAIFADGNAVVIAGDTNVRNFFCIPSTEPVAEHVSITNTGRIIISEGKRAATAEQVLHGINQLRTTAEHVRRAAPTAQIETLEFILATEATFPEGFNVVNNQLVRVLPTGTQGVSIGGIPVTVRRISRR